MKKNENKKRKQDVTSKKKQYWLPKRIPVKQTLQEDNKKKNSKMQTFCNTYTLSTNNKQWDLISKKLGHNGCLIIGAILKINTSLMELSLSDNKIGDEGALHIGEALRINQYLTCLTLGDNKITDVGAIAISESLRGNRTLRDLGLQGNRISDVGG